MILKEESEPGSVDEEVLKMKRQCIQLLKAIARMEGKRVDVVFSEPFKKDRSVFKAESCLF